VTARYPRLGRAAGLVVVALGLAVGLLGCQAQPPLEVLGAAPDYTLTDQTGAPFDSRDLAGRASVVDFIYTRCPDVCPTLSATFGQAQKKLEAERLLGSKVVLVSLSVDPIHDTPEVLAQYGKQFGADSATWKLLTGDWDQMYDVIAGFKVGVRVPRPAPDAPSPGGAELAHTTRVVLVDGQQQVRAYLSGEEMSADDVVRAVKRVVQ
jgi:protein SCO1